MTENKLAVGDAVQPRSDDLATRANSPMRVASFKDGPDGSKNAIAVCTRQGQLAGEFLAHHLEKVSEPPDAAAIAAKAEKESKAHDNVPKEKEKPKDEPPHKQPMFGRKK